MRSSNVTSRQGSVPAPVSSMSDALDSEDPEVALRQLAEASANESKRLSVELLSDVLDKLSSMELPRVLLYCDDEKNEDVETEDENGIEIRNHPLRHAMACADSIYDSLTKIAVGGSQASQEIRQLEQEKEAMEQEANCIATALALRQAETLTNSAWQNRDLALACKTIQPWLQWKLQTDDNQNKQHQKRVMAYTGEYTLDQLERTFQQLQQVLLQKYEHAVQQGNLELIGNYTPLLTKLQLEPKAVQLYVQFLKEVLNQQMEQQLENSNNSPQDQTPVTFPAQMAKIYNMSVAALRHHLPLVSHCLHKANGDIAVVRLVHEHCSNQVLPLFRTYQRLRQLSSVRRHAERIADLYQAANAEDLEDGEFTTHIGSLADVDSAMEEAAMCLQHAESYLRFLQHTCQEVQRARQLRHEREYNNHHHNNNTLLPPTDILPPQTPLHEMVAEVGGQYVVIERCLLLASMHRAYAAESNMEDSKYYRPLNILKPGEASLASLAWQSILVETCFFAARRSTLRAFCTGHAGTAGAMANFCVEALSGGFLEVLRQRAEEYAIALLKPGDGLLVGSVNNYFANTTAAIIGRQQNMATAHAKTTAEDNERRQMKIAQACALLNDIQVAAHHTEQLMAVLNDAIEKGFPPHAHGTEQLVLCVKSFSSVQEQFRTSAEAAMESLESVLKPRIRAIVGEAVGSESSTFMVSPVMKPGVSGGGAGSGGGGGTSARMNYNLNEEAYNFLQLSEGYMSRLCTLLQELIQPLKMYLAPMLWDSLWISIIGTTAKRLETLLRKSKFTALGALAWDSDMRDLVTFVRDWLSSSTQTTISNAAITKACVPLGRLCQMAKVLTVDDVEDILEVISSLKRKGNWDWKLEDAQTFLAQRFPEAKVKEVLQLSSNQELA